MGNLKDYATSTVAVAPSPATSGTSLTVQTGEGTLFPATPFYATVHPDGALPTLANAEKVQVTGISGDVLTIVRAQGSTTAKTISTTWRISNTLFSADIYTPGGTDVAITDGGTGSSTASGARTNLGLGTLATLSTVAEANITLADNTTNNVSTSNHGLTPKASANVYDVLNGNGAWSSAEKLGTQRELQEISSVTTASTSSQGVCFDGTYYYFTENTKLYKYNTSGTLITSRVVTSDGSSTGEIADLCIVGGILYVCCSNYPTPPYNGAVKEYNASDLSYRSVEHSIGSTDIAESIDWDGTYFWIVTDGNVIKRWDSTFSSSTTATVDFTPTAFTASHGWNGLRLKDGYMYLNPHEGAIPNTVQRFRMNGTTLTLDAQYQRPKYCSQGMTTDGDTFIFARRGYSVVTDAVVLAKLVPLDYRQQTLILTDDATARTYAGTTYAEETNLRCSIMAKKDDIIRVSIEGNFKVSAGNLRAYVDVSSTNATAVTALGNARTMRTNFSNTEGTTLTQTQYWAANADGKVVFAMQWKQVSTGTCTVQDRSMTAQIVGKYTD